MGITGSHRPQGSGRAAFSKGGKLIRIELLSTENFKLEFLDNFQRKHNVQKVYRRHAGEYILVDYVYTEDWSMDERRFIAKDISGDNYITYLALEKEEVVGFIAIKKDLIVPYMVLEMLYVSAAYRGHGIGRKLFEVGKMEAGKAGAKALYISACSSKETIAFYKAMGAELADCPIKEMAEKEPCDLQMVCYV